ncbi:MAG: LPS export ABC transporter periplasmic protein LptC [Alphaproteobacteria bacterium]|nr:LPS export ABC transporter periplasmic protein LptC [Alphaproteobacteria bacterium]
MDDENDFYKRVEQNDRMERLSAARDPRPASYNPKYSLFISRMRLVLPLIAAMIIAAVFAWGQMSDDNIIPVESANAPKIIGKNELLNPRFESVDSKNQPYTVTANRAVRGENNDDLVILESPLADMLLTSGNWVAVQAQNGAYRQDNKRLILKGDVEIFHDEGYQMQMAELNLDLNTSQAWSDVDVYGQGPAGTLNAKGLKADNVKGHLVFTGPAKLILRNRGESDLGGVFGE